MSFLASIVESSESSLSKIIGVLVFVFLGLAFRGVGVLGNRDGDLLRRFVLRFPIPALVFFSMYEAQRDELSAMPAMMAAFVVLSAALFLVGLACSRFVSGAPRKAAVHACCVFGNYGWLGYGVCRVLLGEAGFRQAVFFLLLWWPVFYGLGLPIGLIHARRRKGAVPVGKALGVALPLMGAMGAGLAFNLLGWQLPQLVTTALSPFKEMAVPLILFSVGVMMSLRGMRGGLGPALMISGVTLVVAPLLGVGVAAALTGDPICRKVIILEAAMPVAALTPLLAENFEMDLDVTNTAIVVSTLLSMITLPVVATVLGVGAAAG